LKSSSKTPGMSICPLRVASRYQTDRNTLVNMALRGGTGTILPGGTRLYRAELREDIPDGGV